MRRENLRDVTHLRAHALRRSTTGAEKKLWRHLRQLDLDGSHFRRQVPIGPYIADFACMAARLLIEIDGSQHAEDRKQATDEVRTRWLKKEGYRVLRFWNNDIAKNIDNVMEAIYAALYGSLAAASEPLKHQRRRRRGVRTSPPRVASRRAPPPDRGG